MHSSQDASDIVADRVAHIPLVVYVPWLPQSHGQRVSALVEAVDFMPSLIDLAGISHTVPDWKQLEGDSFVPLLLPATVSATPRTSQRGIARHWPAVPSAAESQAGVRFLFLHYRLPPGLVPRLLVRCAERSLGRCAATLASRCAMMG